MFRCYYSTSHFVKDQIAEVIASRAPQYSIRGLLFCRKFLWLVETKTLDLLSTRRQRSAETNCKSRDQAKVFLSFVSSLGRSQFGSRATRKLCDSQSPTSCPDFTLGVPSFFQGSQWRSDNESQPIGQIGIRRSLCENACPPQERWPNKIL